MQEVIKNAHSTRLYWVLFPIEDLRQEGETTKRILTKEKIDRRHTIYEHKKMDTLERKLHLTHRIL